jgi:hypothetical protein
MIGNLYRRDPYYGAYPHGLLDRILTVWPETPRLHVFSGSVKDPDGVTLDIRPECNPDVVASATTMAEHFAPASFAVVLADPPYNGRAHEAYGTRPVDKRAVVRQAATIVRPEGYLIWLDVATPVWSREHWVWAGLIAVQTGTNRAMRALSILRRLHDGESAPGLKNPLFRRDRKRNGAERG